MGNRKCWIGIKKLIVLSEMARQTEGQLRVSLSYYKVSFTVGFLPSLLPRPTLKITITMKNYIK